MFATLAMFLAVSSLQPPDAVSALIDQLDAASLDQREIAEARLIDMPGLSLSQLESIARSADLAPEQRVRIRDIGRRLFDARPLAGMGVQFQGFTEEGVVIGDTIAGFAAKDALQPMDVIQACNGRTTRTQDDLRWAILSHDPGDVLRLEIERDGRALQVDVALGAFDDLPNAMRPTAADLANSFARRWQRTVGDPLAQTPPVGRGISVNDWAGVEAQHASGVAEWPLPRESASRMISFGGQPRTALAARQAVADFSLPVTQPSFARERVSEIADVVDTIRALSRQRMVVDQRAQTLERQAELASDPARKEQLTRMRQDALNELLQIDAQISGMQEALRQLRQTGNR